MLSYFVPKTSYFVLVLLIMGMFSDVKKEKWEGKLLGNVCLCGFLLS